MTKMFGRFSVACVSAIVFLAWQPRNAWPVEPTVEVPTASPTDTATNETGVFSLPHIPLTLSLALHGGYDDNLSTAQAGQAQASWFTNGGANLLYDSTVSATHLILRSGADLTYYPDQSGGRTPSVNTYVDTSLVRNVSERLKLDASVYATYRTEPDFGSNVGADTRQGNFFHTLDSVTATYHWSERVSTVTSDKFQIVQYDSSSSLATSLNRFDDTFGQELHYNLLHAGNTLVAEYRFQIIDYDTAPRDSLTHYALVGLDQDFTSYLKLTVRGGGTFRSYTDAGDEIDPHFEGSLTYLGAHHSSLIWRTSYGIEEPSATDVFSRKTFRTGLNFKYALTDRITASLDAYYHHDDNKGVIPTGSSTGGSGMPISGFSEDVFDVAANLRYMMSRRFSFDLGVEHSEIDSEESTRNYSRYRYSAGVTFTY